MKQFFQSLARRAGYLLISRRHAAARYVENPPHGPLDEVLLRTFDSLVGLNFIQIGANDGVRADPIRDYVLRYQWRGLLVEPVPNLYRDLQRNYARSTQLKFINAAVDERSGTREIHYLAPNTPGAPDWAHGLASFDRNRVVRTVTELGLSEAAIKAERVATITWSEIFTQFGDARCDVLLIDTEGHDIPLLRLLDLQRLQPTVIHFEHGCGTRAEQLECYEKLLSAGYELATSGADTIAYRPRVSSP